MQVLLPMPIYQATHPGGQPMQIAQQISIPLPPGSQVFHYPVSRNPSNSSMVP